MRLFVFALLLSGAVGCSHPCEELAYHICSCLETRAQQESCKLSIDAAKENIDVSSDEDDRCQGILDSGKCTCEAIDAGDYAACGLANDASLGS